MPIIILLFLLHNYYPLISMKTIMANLARVDMSTGITIRIIALFMG